MRYVWTILTLVFVVAALLACQAADLSTPVPAEQASQTEMSESHPDREATLALTPTLPQEKLTMVPVTPPDEASEKMVLLVKGHLAQRLGMVVDQIVLSDVKAVVWRDGGLGCPKPGVDYIPMKTPGYKITLDVGGQTYTYHTDAGKRFVLCNRL